MSELGVSVDLQEELATWISEYDDDLLFGETPRSASWIATGMKLLRALQDELSGHIPVAPGEDFWLATDDGRI